MNIITEEVIPRGEDVSQIDSKLQLRLKNMIESEKTSTLTIIDPWFFKIDSAQQDRLVAIFESASVKDLRVYFDRDDRINRENFKQKLNAVDISLTTKSTEEFHDRFWIVGNQGFYTGTSFNGLGKKLSLLKDLDSDEVQNIIAVINEIA